MEMWVQYSTAQLELCSVNENAHGADSDFDEKNGEIRG